MRPARTVLRALRQLTRRPTYRARITVVDPALANTGRDQTDPWLAEPVATIRGRWCEAEGFHTVAAALEWVRGWYSAADPARRPTLRWAVLPDTTASTPTAAARGRRGGRLDAVAAQ